MWSAHSVCLFSQLWRITYLLFAFKNGAWVILCVVTYMTALGVGRGTFGLFPLPPDWVMHVGMLFGLCGSEVEI
jgi:hypothetical protein